jgi:DNA-directed RNA polymerase specialized sigma24 family protein
MEQATAELPGDYRQTVVLRRLEEPSLDEVTSIMGRIPRAIEENIDRAKKKLRVSLAPLAA